MEAPRSAGDGFARPRDEAAAWERDTRRRGAPGGLLIPPQSEGKAGRSEAPCTGGQSSTVATGKETTAAFGVEAPGARAWRRPELVQDGQAPQRRLTRRVTLGVLRAQSSGRQDRTLGGQAARATMVRREQWGCHKPGRCPRGARGHRPGWWKQGPSSGRCPGATPGHAGSRETEAGTRLRAQLCHPPRLRVHVATSPSLDFPQRTEGQPCFVTRPVRTS